MGLWYIIIGSPGAITPPSNSTTTYTDIIHTLPINPQCDLTDSFLNNQLYKYLFYICIYVSSVIKNQIPFLLAIPFFFVQASTYAIFVVLKEFTPIYDYASIVVAVCIMVVTSSLLSHRFFRFLPFLKKMTPMATIIPSVQILVPGATM
eukprot:Pgem_evm1s10171